MSRLLKSMILYSQNLLYVGYVSHIRACGFYQPAHLLHSDISTYD